MKFSINELQKMLGLSRSAILYYEKHKILFPRRLENGYREFSAEDMIRLKQIIVLRNIGFDVHDIERLLSAEQRDTAAVFEEAKQALQKEIAQKEQLLLALREIADPPSDSPCLTEASPFLITAEPCCDVEHHFFSKSEVSQALIRNLGFSDIYYLLPERIMQENPAVHLQQYIDSNYRGIPANSTADVDLNSTELRLCTPGLCAYNRAKSTKLVEKLCELREYIDAHNLFLNGTPYIRVRGFYVLSQNQDDMYCDLFVPVKTEA